MMLRNPNGSPIEFWDRVLGLVSEPVATEAQEVFYDQPWNIGEVSAAYQRTFVRAPDGTRVDTRLTAESISAVILTLDLVRDMLVGLAAAQVADERTWPGNRSPDVVAFNERLDGYRDAVIACLNAGRGDDPSCVYDSVVSPLFLGYFPEDNFKTKRPADVTFIYRWMNALEIDQQVKKQLGPASLGFLLYEATTNKIPEIAAVALDETKKNVERISRFVKAQAAYTKKYGPLIAVGAGLAGLAVLAVMYGPRRR